MAIETRIRPDGATEYACIDCKRGVAIDFRARPEVRPEVEAMALAEAAKSLVYEGCPHQGVDPLHECPFCRERMSDKAMAAHAWACHNRELARRRGAV